MKLKLNEAGHVVVSDGKPVYIDDTGKEVAFDAAATVATITRITEESKGYKSRAQAAETSLKAFEGITDPAAARKALDTVRNLDDKKLVDAGEVEKVKAEAIKAVEARYKPIVDEAEALKASLHAEKIGGSFLRSKFIADKIAVPPDIIEARFGKNFKLENGKVIAYDQSGNPLYSKASPGNPADFDEALEILVDAYPYKEHILKGTGGTGGGARPSGGTGGTKTVTRAEFNKMSPDAQRQISLDVGAGKASLVD
jgi:hypothetical protein